MKAYRFRKVIQNLFGFEIYRIITWILINEGSKRSRSIVRQKYYAPYFYKKKKSNEKYYVFRISVDSGSHIMSIARRVPGIYSWAEKNGYIPIIFWGYEEDMKNRDYSHNLWELVFEQIPIQEVLNKEYVFFEELNRYQYDLEYEEYIGNKIITDSDDIKGLGIGLVVNNYREYYKKIDKYIVNSLRFSRLFVERYNTDVKINTDNTLAICVNETFFSETNERIISEGAVVAKKEHPNSKGVNELIRQIDEVKDRWSFDKIFISCQSIDTIEQLIFSYGADKIYFIEKNRFTNDEMVEAAEMHKYQFCDERFIKYAEEIVTVSKCKYLIGNLSSGAIMAMTFNSGRYEDVIFLQQEDI